MLAPISCAASAPLRPVGAIRLAPDRGAGRARGGRDVVRRRGLDHVSDPRRHDPHRLFGGPGAGRQGMGGPAHRHRVRARRGVRPDPQQLRLPAAHLQRVGQHASRHHDPRVLIGEYRPGLRAIRRPRPLRRDQRRRSSSEAPLRGNDPPRHPDGHVPARANRGGLPPVLRAHPSAQGRGRGDRRGSARRDAAGPRRHRPGSRVLRAFRGAAHRRRPRQILSAPSDPTNVGRCWAERVHCCT